MLLKKLNLPKKLKLGSICLLFLFMILGCSSKNYTLHFKDEMILDYKSKDSPLLLIEKIGDEKVTLDMIKNNKIEIDNFMVECDKVSTDKIGTYDVKYTTNETDNRFHTKTIKVADISAPVIELKEKELSMTLDEYKKFDFSTIITVIDNWDKEEPTVSLTADEISKEGSYVITVLAEDIAGNLSTKKINITIKSKEVEVAPTEQDDVEQSVEQPIIPNNGGQSNVPVQPSLPNDKSIQPLLPDNQPIQPSNPKPSNRDFLFVNGYTMDNVGNACNVALQSSGYSGACNPIKDASGIYIGMRLEFY